jgi:hypothetical protein
MTCPQSPPFLKGDIGGFSMGLYGANGIRPGRPPVAPTEKSPLSPLYERGEEIVKLAPMRQNLVTSGEREVPGAIYKILKPAREDLLLRAASVFLGRTMRSTLETSCLLQEHADLSGTLA